MELAEAYAEACRQLGEARVEIAATREAPSKSEAERNEADARIVALLAERDEMS